MSASLTSQKVNQQEEESMRPPQRLKKAYITPGRRRETHFKTSMERVIGFLLVSITMVAMAMSAEAGSVVPALYVFGDSTVDVGNNNFLLGNQGKANFPPYGIDFPGGKPTGRFSNGYEGIDYFAQALGFLKSPPAYLSLTNDLQAYRGVSFASGGSGIFNITGQGFSISLNQQIGNFQEVSRRLRTLIGDTSANILLSMSVFYFSTANNDMILFFAATGIQNQTQQDIFLEQLASQFKNQLQTLYNLGARKFLVFGTSLIGCIPILRLGVPSGGCLKYLNNLSQQFNRLTRGVLSKLSSDLKGFSYSFIDVYGAVSLVSSQPLKYGFTETASACCGSGRLNAETACSSNASYCSNRGQQFYWDQFHPTQSFYKYVIRSALDGTRYASPVSIRQLISNLL